MSAREDKLRPLALIANPCNRRADFFQAALRRLGLAPAVLVPYLNLVADPGDLAGHIDPGSLVRIDSPGEDFEVEKGLLLLGADAAESEGCAHLTASDVRRLAFDRGRIWFPRQWYLGYCRLLSCVELACKPRSCTLRNEPADIRLMFDKHSCHDLCRRAGVSVPPALQDVTCFEDLIAKMGNTGLDRVFVKLSHGSSASGVIALQRTPAGAQAFTSAEIVVTGGQVRLYNSLKIQHYTRTTLIAKLVDELCRHRVHVEQWLPKAAIDRSTFDLRIVVIGGEPRHVVARKSRSPITNLHLGNRRGEIAPLLERLGPHRWSDVLESCRSAAALFPNSLSMGIDMCLSPGWRRHAVLEINAFGNLLPGVEWRGMDTYTAEVAAITAMGHTNESGRKRLVSERSLDAR